VRSVEHGFGELRHTLAEQVTSRRKATVEEISQALSQYRAPVIIHSYLATESWGPHSSGVVDELIKFWDAFPDLPLTTRLFICLFVIYRKPGPAGPPPAPSAARRRDGSMSAREYFRRLNFSAYSGVRGVVLPEMLPISLEDAENFFRDENHFKELCPICSPLFCNTPSAIEEIRSYYKGVGDDDPRVRVPMQDLAKELGRVLEENFC
jgi:hypothetical protein